MAFEEETPKPERRIRRVESGIPGLDEILNGGIPFRNVVLLSGGAG
ncbi:MAG: ATPase domain-containing protein, partial [Thermofilaceae archaeon]